MRENIIDLNPQDTLRALVKDKARRTMPRMATIDVGDRKITRHRISAEKRPFADEIIRIANILKDYWPISERAIHYRLIDHEVYRNTKLRLLYTNDRNSSDDLSDMVSRLRIFGELSWDAIEDETRPVTSWNTHKNESDYFRQEMAGFMDGYFRDLMQSQHHFFVIVTEKLTVKRFVDDIGAEFTIPVVVIRGNSSKSALWDIVKRFRASGKENLFLFCLGDCDPSGDNIVDTTIISLRHDFHLGEENVQGVRVAMTHRQAEQLKLPKDLQANEDDSNYERFVAKHGRTDCYELDAVDPEKLKQMLRHAILSVVDIDLYNKEVDALNAGEEWCQGIRKAFNEFVQSRGAPTCGDDLDGMS
jgi:hypothetical protein